MSPNIILSRGRVETAEWQGENEEAPESLIPGLLAISGLSLSAYQIFIFKAFFGLTVAIR